MLPHCGLDGKHVSAINGFKIGDVTLVPSAAGGPNEPPKLQRTITPSAAAPLSVRSAVSTAIPVRMPERQSFRAPQPSRLPELRLSAPPKGGFETSHDMPKPTKKKKPKSDANNKEDQRRDNPPLDQLS
jgi:hypothetical protein